MCLQLLADSDFAQNCLQQPERIYKVGWNLSLIFYPRSWFDDSCEEKMYTRWLQLRYGENCKQFKQQQSAST